MVSELIPLCSQMIEQIVDLFIPELTKNLDMFIIIYNLLRIEFYPSLHPKILVRYGAWHVFDI